VRVLVELQKDCKESWQGASNPKSSEREREGSEGREGPKQTAFELLKAKNDIDTASGQDDLWLCCMGQHGNDPRDSNELQVAREAPRDLSLEESVQRYSAQEERILRPMTRVRFCDRRTSSSRREFVSSSPKQIRRGR
jgi:hypothetical protein